MHHSLRAARLRQHRLWLRRLALSYKLLTMNILPQGSTLSPVFCSVYTKGLAALNSNSLSRVLTLAGFGLIFKTASDTRTGVTSDREQLEPPLSQWSKINPSKAQALWCSLDNRGVGQAKTAVCFNGELMERTNSLRYLGIHSRRMLMHKTQFKSTILRCEK